MPRPLWLAGLCAALAGCAVGPDAVPWIDLLAGAGTTTSPLGEFVASQFGGDGEVVMRDGAMHMGIGSPLTGVTWTGTPPAGDYELEVTAARVSGNDFFCGITFPVGAEHLTLVLGGWGGAVSGLSCLDDQDASRNATRTLHHFRNGRDYVVRVRVRNNAIAVLLDGAPFLATGLTNHRLSLRPEVELSRPLGIASFATETAVRSVRWRQL